MVGQGLCQRKKNVTTVLSSPGTSSSDLAGKLQDENDPESYDDNNHI